MDESYTSLPTSHLLGSVLAVVEDIQANNDASPKTRSQIPEANTSSAGSGGSQGYQTIEAQYAEGSEQLPNSWRGLFSISSYTPYFNVDTDVVVTRIFSSFYPKEGDFLNKITANPDLYGFVWISTSLIFVLAAFGNLATYLVEKKSGSSSTWNFDVGYISLAMWSVYGYAIFVPLGFYFLLRYFNCNASLIRFWCLWGYSLFVYIPASLLLLIPVEFIRWMCILGVGVHSACFVTFNLKPIIEVSDLSVVLVATFCLQLALAIFVKVWFFH